MGQTKTDRKKNGANDNQAKNETHKPYKHAIHGVPSLADRRIALRSDINNFYFQTSTG
mgnify:CR=1 FL=1